MPYAMENPSYAYWETIVANRSLDVNEEDWLEGNTLVSIETLDPSLNLPVYCKENFRDLMQYLVFLNPEDRRVILLYFILGVNQTSLSKIIGISQTSVSSMWRLAARKLGFFIMMKGVPSDEDLNRVFIKSKLPNQKFLSQALCLFRKLGTYSAAAKGLSVRKEEIKGELSKAAKLLDDSKLAEVTGLGAYIHDLIDHKSSNGVGMNGHKAKRQVRVLHLKDPDCTGKFRIKIGEKGFESMFVAKSNLYHQEE